MYSFNELVDSLRPAYVSRDKTVKVFKLDASSFHCPVALKQLYCHDQEQANQLAEEARLMMANPHPHICECLDYHTEPSRQGGFFLYVSMRWIDRTLEMEIEKRAKSDAHNRNSLFPEETLWKYLGQLVSALAFLQRKGIAHRDIKPANILIDQDDCIKVCDFGFAKRISNSGTVSSTLLGSAPFMSPILRQALIQNSFEPGEVQHDVFKSDVYSVGVTMAYLTELELQDEFTNLKDQHKVLEEFFSEITDYSDEWIDTLRILMMVEESLRPDFIQIEKIMRREISYADDEQISAFRGQDEVAEPLKCSMKFGMNYLRVSPTLIESVPCMVSMEAMKRDPRSRLYTIDLVCVIDVSGSMEGQPLELVKTSLKDFLIHLSDRDRMCLISFSDNAIRKCPLIACTETGKQRLQDCIDSLKNEDLTNIVAGFEMAIQVIQQRRVKNSEVSLMLFSDGKDNYNEGEIVKERCFEALKRDPIKNLSVHSFGFRTAIDVDLLQSLATQGNGLFHFIENESDIKSAFSSAFASLTSISARDIRVSIEVAQQSPVGCRISKVYSKDESLCFHLPSISSNERKDLIFLLETAKQGLTKATMFSPVKVHVTYIDSEGVEIIRNLETEIKFRPWTDVCPSSDEQVIANWYRLKGVHWLQEARDCAEHSQFSEAVVRLRTGIQELEGGRFREMVMLRDILADMRKVLEMMDKNVWEAGKVHVDSISYKHYSISAKNLG